MGNCHAAEVAAVVIQHPAANKIERIHSSVSVNHVMASNPGHYVALVVASPAFENDVGGGSPPLMQLKLLRPDDTLLLGNVYRLVSFEDVLKEFGGKKRVKVRREGLSAAEPNKHDMSFQDKGGRSQNCNYVEKLEQQVQGEASIDSHSSLYTRRHQWRPTLQSIAEVGTMAGSI